MGGYGSGRTSKVGRRPRHKMFVEWVPFLNSFECMTNTIAVEKGFTLTMIGSDKVLVTQEQASIYPKHGSLKARPTFSSTMQIVEGRFGKRYYFTCPYCNIRTSRLYHYRYLACRKCHNLAYRSQNMSNEDRWLQKRERLLKRYSVSFEEASCSLKPKSRQRGPFDRLLKEFRFITEAGTAIHFNRFEYKNVLQLLRKCKKTGVIYN